MRILARLPAILHAVLLLAGATAATAQQWYQHYEWGLEAAAEGRWQEALDHLEEASLRQAEPRERLRTYGNRFLFDYDPSFYKARCLIALGRLAEAEVELQRSAAAAVTDRDRLAALRATLDAAQEGAEEAPTQEPLGPEPVAPPEPARLTLTSTPSGAAVAVDGREVGRTPLRDLEIASRRHRIAVSLDGFETWRTEIVPEPGEVLEQHRDLVSLPGPEAKKSRPPSPGEALPVASAQAPAEVADERETDLPPPPPRSGMASSDQQTSAAPVESAASPPSASVRRSAEPARARVDSKAPESSGEARVWLWALPLVILLAAGLWLGRRRPGRSSIRSVTGWRHLPSVIGGYELIEELGRGGMATTWRARRRADRREVALKIPHDTGDPTYGERFLREGRLGESLHHPRIVRIHEVGEDQGIPFLAMELLPGCTLREALEDEGEELELGRILEVVRDVAEALDYAHHKGVVHRDLKPENIMILPDGSAKVMDFGVARIEGLPGLTTSKAFFGSPLYAAPELTLEPKDVDLRADLYSLGIVLFELVEGHPPFVDESIFRVLEMHRSEPLAPLASPIAEQVPELERLIGKLCAKDRDERFPSADRLLVEVGRLALDSPRLDPRSREHAARGGGESARASRPEPRGTPSGS